VYALDSRTGALAWKTAVGPPVPRTSLPCGNIDPLGITGTPAIDERTQALYLDAMVRDKASNETKHLIFALSLKDGSVLPGWPVDVEAALKAGGQTFRSSVQSERGALTLAANTLYVAYGGHFGDCGDYHGRVVGISLQATHAVRSWSTRAHGGGVWAPGGVSSDGTALYIATGNTMGATRWEDGEAIIRLAPDLGFSGQPRDYFAPSDWLQLDARDADLGGTNPLLISLSGATAPELVLALGKDGNAYLLDRNRPGGIGGQLAVKQVSSVRVRNAPASFTLHNAAIVVFVGSGSSCPGSQSGNVVALRISADHPTTIATHWCQSAPGNGAPIVTTTDGKSDPIVWVLGATNDNKLHGFRGSDGKPLYTSGALAGLHDFQTLIAAQNRLYVAGDNKIYAFKY